MLQENIKDSYVTIQDVKNSDEDRHVFYLDINNDGDYKLFSKAEALNILLYKQKKEVDII